MSSGLGIIGLSTASTASTASAEGAVRLMGTNGAPFRAVYCGEDILLGVKIIVEKFQLPGWRPAMWEVARLASCQIKSLLKLVFSEMETFFLVAIPDSALVCKNFLS